MPPETRAEIAVLKGIVAANVMSTNSRKPIYTRQRGILTELADGLWARPEHLDIRVSPRTGAPHPTTPASGSSSIRSRR